MHLESDGAKYSTPQTNMAAVATQRATRSESCCLNLMRRPQSPRNQKKKQPSGRIDDLMANIERQTTPHTSQHAIHMRTRIKKTAQPDLSTGQESALQQAMQHNKNQNTTVHPNTGVPHTPYVSPMRCWTMNFQRDSNP